MKKNSILMFALLMVFAFGLQNISAQITITLPKIPKLKKTKKEPPNQEQPKENQHTTPTGNLSGDGHITGNKPAAAADKCTESMWLETHLEEIAKRQKEVDEFTPERGWFTKSFTYDHLLNAVSPSAREKWLKGSNALDFKNCANLVSAFNALADSAAKKLPLYAANPKAYNFRSAAEEKMMKAALENLATLKIHKIGLNQASWLISKDDYGLPTSRYKHGMIWARDSADDHAFCRIYYVNIIQDYAGGGTYAASYAYYAGDELAGCPVL